MVKAGCWVSGEFRKWKNNQFMIAKRMSHQFYSVRKGTNPNLNGLPLRETLGLFVRLYNQLHEDGYFHEAFGFVCVDAGDECR